MRASPTASRSVEKASRQAAARRLRSREKAVLGERPALGPGSADEPVYKGMLGSVALGQQGMGQAIAAFTPAAKRGALHRSPPSQSAPAKPGAPSGSPAELGGGEDAERADQDSAEGGGLEKGPAVGAPLTEAVPLGAIPMGIGGAQLLVYCEGSTETAYIASVDRPGLSDAKYKVMWHQSGMVSTFTRTQVLAGALRYQRNPEGIAVAQHREFLGMCDADCGCERTLEPGGKESLYCGKECESSVTGVAIDATTCLFKHCDAQCMIMTNAKTAGTCPFHVDVALIPASMKLVVALAKAELRPELQRQALAMPRASKRYHGENVASAKRGAAYAASPAPRNGDAGPREAERDGDERVASAQEGAEGVAFLAPRVGSAGDTETSREPEPARKPVARRVEFAHNETKIRDGKESGLSGFGEQDLVDLAAKVVFFKPGSAETIHVVNAFMEAKLGDTTVYGELMTMHAVLDVCEHVAASQLWGQLVASMMCLEKQGIFESTAKRGEVCYNMMSGFFSADPGRENVLRIMCDRRDVLRDFHQGPSPLGLVEGREHESKESAARAAAAELEPRAKRRAAHELRKQQEARRLREIKQQRQQEQTDSWHAKQVAMDQLRESQRVERDGGQLRAAEALRERRRMQQPREAKATASEGDTFRYNGLECTVLVVTAKGMCVYRSTTGTLGEISMSDLLSGGCDWTRADVGRRSERQRNELPHTMARKMAEGRNASGAFTDGVAARVLQAAEAQNFDAYAREAAGQRPLSTMEANGIRRAGEVNAYVSTGALAAGKSRAARAPGMRRLRLGATIVRPMSSGSETVSPGTNTQVKLSTATKSVTQDEMTIINNPFDKAKEGATLSHAFFAVLMQQVREGAKHTVPALQPDGTFRKMTMIWMREVQSWDSFSAFIEQITVEIHIEIAMHKGFIANGIDVMGNEASVTHLELARDGFEVMFGELAFRWKTIIQPVMAADKRVAMGQRFFNYINLVLKAWHYELYQTGTGIFFCNWSNKIWALAEVIDPCVTYSAPARCKDPNAVNQMTMLRLRSQSGTDGGGGSGASAAAARAGGGGQASFAGTMQGIKSMTRKQKAQLQKALQGSASADTGGGGGGGNGGGGGGKPRQPRGKDLSKVKCFNCGLKGHFSRDCPKPKTAETKEAESKRDARPRSDGGQSGS